MGYIKQDITLEPLMTNSEFWVDYSAVVDWKAQKRFNAIGDDDNSGRTHALLVEQIKDWNLTDEADQPLELTEENIGLINRDDALHLVAVIGEAIQKRAEENQQAKKA